jgi:hypothetical protein
MFTLLRCFGILAVGVLAIAGAGLRAQNPAQSGSAQPPFNQKPFSADMTMSGPMGSQQGKVYAGENAYRSEMTMRQGMTMATIVRYDKKVVWMLMPGNRYMEMPLGERAGMAGALRDKTAKFETQDLGTEKVGAYDCEKYHVHTTTANYETNGLVWVGKSGDAKGFLVKTQDEKSGMTVEYSNIKAGEPDASVFEVPAGYQKMEMPNMPGGMPHP